ncbi:MAG: T9SS type A sorting domain-containing protein [Saprospiraceae bacterium]
MKCTFTFIFSLIVIGLFGQPSISLPSGYSWVLSGSSNYQNGPFYTGNASGNSGTSCCGGVSTSCGSMDTSFGGNVQCASVPWTVVGTPGANFIQDQEYGNIGTCDNGLAGLAVPCNPGVGGTGAGSNWPNSTSETRQVSMTNWDNDYPSSSISSLPEVSRTSGTVWLPTSAILRLRDDGVGNGTGAGADELRLTMIGGNDNSCSSWRIIANYNLSLDVEGDYGDITGVDGIKIEETVIQDLSNIPNATGSNAYNATNGAHHSCCGGGCSFQATQNSWFFSGGVNTPSFGSGYTADYDILNSLIENGSTFNVNFTSEQSIEINRTGGDSGDARATMGPGMGGKIELIVTYEIWTIQAPAPVTMTHFDVKKVNNTTSILWSTASEVNNGGWYIQRSTDGFNWENLQFVSGKGNSNEKVDYVFSDNLPLTGSNFYRLRQTDFDGKDFYSDVKEVRFSIGSNVKLYPNPTNGDLFLDNVAEGTHYAIYDVKGKEMLSGTIREHQKTINLTDLQNGIYAVRLMSNDDISVLKVFRN